MMSSPPDHNMDESAHFSPYRADGKLYGFVCIVQGADQPIGKAIVHELATHGAACVYACAENPDHSIVDEVSKESPKTKIIPYPLHVGIEEDTIVLIDDVLNQWGRLDVFVLTPTLLGPPSLTLTSPSDLHSTFTANALAPFFALKYGPAAMLKTSPRGSYANAAPKDTSYGSIIVVSSVASTYGGCWGPAFTMSCHAALGVVRSGVSCLKGTGVRINAISPGQIDVGVNLGGAATNGDKVEKEALLKGMNAQLPPSQLQSAEVTRTIVGLERPGVPQEVARVAGFLASGFSSYVTGSNVVVDGGASVMNPLTLPL